MRIGKLFTVLAIPMALCSCQSESPVETDHSGHKLTVRAFLPDSGDTRTHITYGNPDIDWEVFRWHEISEVYNDNDYITVINASRLSDTPNYVELNAVEVNGNTAVFESPDKVDDRCEIKAGDILFVSYFDSRTNTTSDKQVVFTMDVGTESNKPQYIVENPADCMEYMQGNLKMYDIVTAVEDDKIPDIHFRHLSAILRVSLRNETGHEIFPTKLDFEYPGTESFFNTTLYCSLDPEAADGSGISVYEGPDFFTGVSKVYTDNIGTTINGKDGTYDSGGSIANGNTYDLYISTVPRIANTVKGNKLIITLTEAHKTKTAYSTTLDGFNVPIEAGKRYWFNLTAVEEVSAENDTTRSLMLTSDWLEAHPGAKPYYK